MSIRATLGENGKVIKQPFRVGLVQMSCPDPKDNLAKAVEKVREAAARGAQVVLLQEAHHGGMFVWMHAVDLGSVEIGRAHV